MNDPRISVVMAVRNASRYLRTALDSVAAQTRPASEVVLVDGRSTDDTETIARTYSFVRFIQESGHGYASAWNDGIRAAGGDLIALLDSDDRWMPEKLALQTAALAADPRARAVIGHVEFFAEPDEELPPGFKVELLNGSYVAYMPGALLAQRTLFDDIGFFDTTWTIANDIDWFAHLKDRQVPVAVVPQTVIHKRVHSQNLSYVTARSGVVNHEMIRLLRDSIHRQRQTAAMPASGRGGSAG